MEPERDEQRPESSRLTVWPIGFAVGVVCLLVGIVVSWWIAAIGGASALVFGALWVTDIVSGHKLATAPHEPSVEQAAGTPSAQPASAPGTSSAERFPRNKFLEGATLGLGVAIGAILTIPPLFLALIPPFLKQGRGSIDVGRMSDYPQNQWVVTTFLLKPGQVNRRTAYIRNNGIVNTPNGAEPSFTIVSNRCVHVGCPTQPNGLVQNLKTKQLTPPGGLPVTQRPAQGVSGFGCPCHGGQYDSEGNRTAGPPVRALDRYEFSIKNGRLYLGKVFSVSSVSGTGANAEIHAYRRTAPGNHVDGWEQIFYPLQPPS